MIKSVRFQNWKSFRDATLYIDPLTILIGTNASGKSNAVDGLEFLSRMARDEKLESIFNGTATTKAIRGGASLAAYKFSDHFEISSTIINHNHYDEIENSYAVGLKHTASLLNQTTILRKMTCDLVANTSPDKYTKTLKVVGHYVNKITTESYNLHDIINRFNELSDKGEVSNDGIDINKLPGDSNNDNDKIELIRNDISSDNMNISLPDYKLLMRYIETVSSSIFIFKLNSLALPSYSPMSFELLEDGSNIAGVLASLGEERTTEISAVLQKYVSRLPENDIGRIWAEKVGRFGSDAMLYCEEKWGKDGEPVIFDARGMSDGTLRFVAIAVALMTRPAGSLLVIEDVDAGLHPSRAGVLLQMLKEVGRERKVDVLVTTHNPALLDALTPDFVPFVTVAHRDPETGESMLTLVEELDDLPRLLASGGLGKASTSGALERSLRNAPRKSTEQEPDHGA
ncbi:MAG: AAA family ATPase [Rhodospirillaceae bacterium]